MVLSREEHADTGDLSVDFSVEYRGDLSWDGAERLLNSTGCFKVNGPL